MPEIPRKPSIPPHLIQKYIQQITQDVQNDVIPVSAGIYTEQGLIQKLKGLSKPILENYDNPIFYQLSDNFKEATNTFKNSEIFYDKKQCHFCRANTLSTKTEFSQCSFCGNTVCAECLHFRTRLHPLDANPLGQRYKICNQCDTKYLSLQLSHPYFENMTLIQYSIMQVTQQLEQLESQVDQRKKVKQQGQKSVREEKVKVSIEKKKKTNLQREIKGLRHLISEETDRNKKIRGRYEEAKYNYNQRMLKQKQERQRQRLLQQQRERQQQYRNDHKSSSSSNRVDDEQNTNKPSNYQTFQQYFTNPDQNDIKDIEQQTRSNIQEVYEQNLSEHQHHGNRQQYNRETIQQDTLVSQITYHQQTEAKPQQIYIESSQVRNSMEDEPDLSRVAFNNNSTYFGNTVDLSDSKETPNKNKMIDLEAEPEQQEIQEKKKEILKAALFHSPRHQHHEAQGYQDNEEPKEIVYAGEKCKCAIF